MLEVRSNEHPDRVAVIDVEQQTRRTYRELEERASRTANMLWALGVRPGDNLGLLMHNCAEFLEVVFAVAKIGATAVLVNRRLSISEMAYELSDSNSVGLIYSPKFDAAATELAAIAGDVGWWCRSGGELPGTGPSGLLSMESLLAQADPSFEPPAGVELAEAGLVIIYTSGTTGKPKGVVLTQANIMAANDCTKRYLWARYGAALAPVVRGLVTAGMNHIGGLNTSSMPVLSDGGTLVVLDEFNPRRMLESIEKYQVNLAFSIGTMWNAVVEEDLSAYDLSSLAVVGTCIARHTDEQLRALHQGLGAEVYYMFGQTETTTGLITTEHTVDLWQRPGTLGKRMALMDVRIVNHEGKPAQVDEVGELQYRGPTVFKEYYGRPDETAQAFEDGWFRSGDLVKRDADGYFYFVDRIKDMIKSGGLNVFTVEVEQVLVQHPALQDVAVAGVPDQKWGEAVTAFVVASDGAAPSEDEVISFCRERIAHYKVPKRVIFVEAIPVNSLGKKLKRALVDALAP
ncbi:long-chain fatty acid--CoA ligase [Nocardioides humi]|uniref:Long-chain fatty acid--CoA ligase n=2 Tax=Nocardioides humi TaxID=449461 RepID=A0ABN1ZWF6_9ACTN